MGKLCYTDTRTGVLRLKGMRRIIIVSIILCLVFSSCKKANNNPTYNYVLYSQKIAEIMDEKIRNMENLEIYPYYINDELREELVKQNYKNPSKATILIYKYSVNGPLPYSIEHENNLPDVLKKEKYKAAVFSVFEHFCFEISTELIPTTYAFLSYDLFVDSKLIKQPAICILEYDDAYPIVIYFVTGENDAVATKSTIVFDKKINQEAFTSDLFWTNLELDGMYVFPLK